MKQQERKNIFQEIRHGALIYALGCVLMAAGVAQAAQMPLYSIVSRDAIDLGGFTGVPVELDTEMLREDGPKEFVIELADGRQFELSRERVITRKPDNYTWFGRVPGGLNRTVIAVVNGWAAGNISLPEGGIVELRPTPNGLLLVDRALDSFHKCGGSIPVTDEIRESIGSQSRGSVQPENLPHQPPMGSDVATRADDGSVMQVLVVYTTDAANTIGSGKEAYAQLAVDQMNEAFTNSNVASAMNLAAVIETGYVEAGSFDVDLTRITATSDGFMDEVPTYRNFYRADFVALFRNGVYNACGIAWVNQQGFTDISEYAYSVTHINCISNDTFSHELGHNLGCAHARVDPGGAGYYDYSYGYKSGTDFRTIMAYECSPACPRIRHYSNPNVNYNGDPTGIADGNPNSADCAQTISNLLLASANFREGEPDPSLPTTTEWGVILLLTTFAAMLMYGRRGSRVHVS